MNLGDPRQFALVFPAPGQAPFEGSLWVDGRNLLAHTRGQEVLTRLRAPWDELVRWFIDAWSSFFETQRWPTPSRATDALRYMQDLERELRQVADERAQSRLRETTTRFLQTHRLGGDTWPDDLPDVFLSRDADEVVVAWRAPRPTSDRCFLAPNGEARISAHAFAEAVRSFIEWRGAVSGGRLRQDAITWSQTLNGAEGARRAIRNEAGLTEDEVAGLLARSGLDFDTFFAIDRSDLEAGALTSAAASPVAMAFRSSAPTLDAESRLALRNLVVCEPVHTRGRDLIGQLRARLPRPDSNLPHYEQGYEMAITMRKWLGRPHQPLDVEALLTRTLSVPVRDLALADGDLDGGCVFGAHSGPLVFVNTEARMSGTGWGRRMTLAHELCHLLLDKPPERTLSHVSGIWSVPRLERRANAFAAELLLPRAALMRALERGIGYTEVMETYGVGLTTATWQVRNRLDRDLPQVEPRASVHEVAGRLGEGAMTAEQYQVVFTLLAEPELELARESAIAQRAGARLSDVEHVLARMAQRGHVRTRDGRRRVARTAELARWWLMGYTDVVRPLNVLDRIRLELPGSRDELLASLAARLEADTDWCWSGEAAAWIRERSLRPHDLVVVVDGNHAPAVRPSAEPHGGAARSYPVTFLRLFCPAARGDRGGRTAHPLLIWSELMQQEDPRVREIADALLKDALEP